MWLKRRKTPSSEIPKLQQEYLRLLQDTLTDIRPLQDVTQLSCGGGQANAAVQKQWKAQQRALRPGVETGKRTGTQRIEAPQKDRMLESVSIGR